jgi:transposase InsO family protein
MWDVFRTVLCSALSALKTQRDLALENLALRHQLAVYERQKRKPRLEHRDRLIWIGLRRLWPSWQTALTLVQPATVVKWHREGFRSFWRRKSRASGGRPRIHLEVRNLIRGMWNANPTWGRPRIQSELAKLGLFVSDSTVRRYRPHRSKPPSQTWRTFLSNHAKDIVAIDFFTVPTLRFRVLYVLLIMSHDRRKVAHFNVTDSPSAQWTGQQIIEAFPYDTAPKYLLRDRDGIYGAHFVRRVKSMGIEEVLTAARSPWQNPYCERLIGSVRRECLDHVVVVNEHHLLRVLNDYFAYYHRSRTHQSLGNDSPEPRAVEPPERGTVVAFPQVAGLHHRYRRVPTQLAA